MEYGKDIIQSRLEGIEDLEDRKLLKKVLYDVFWNMRQYDMEMYERLEKRIYEELDDPLDKYYLYTTVMDKDALDPISSFFHEMGANADSNSHVLDTLFLSCDALHLQDILHTKRQYPCTITTSENIYIVMATLRQCTKYINEIEKLYRIFRTNGIPWSTVHCPYAYHFVDVVACQPLEFSEEIKSIQVDLGNDNDKKWNNMVGVWNIAPVTLQDKAFPMPAKNKIHFEHVVSHGDEEFENGYLITEENMEFTYMKRFKKDLSILSPYPDQQEWNIIRIENRNYMEIDKTVWEVATNYRRMGFAGRYASQKSLIVRTKSEIDRILSCYALSEQLHLIGMRILDSYEGREQTYACNSFVEDNIRVDEYKKILLLRFLSDEAKDYLVYDKMSFFTSEIQMLFPEFRCIGELVV